MCSLGHWGWAGAPCLESGGPVTSSITLSAVAETQHPTCACHCHPLARGVQGPAGDFSGVCEPAGKLQAPMTAGVTCSLESLN